MHREKPNKQKGNTNKDMHEVALRPNKCIHVQHMSYTMNSTTPKGMQSVMKNKEASRQEA